MYCAKCSRVVEGLRCPVCGRRNLRLPVGEDFCFLTETTALWQQALEDLLTDSGVEFVTRNVYGAAQVKMTGIPERVRFFVPYARYEQARELEQAFFNGEFTDFPEEPEETE